MIRVLLIDDDEKLGKLLSQYFLQFEMQLSHALTPSDGLAKIKSSTIDLIILDVMMPEMDGFNLCKKIRAISSLPIIMLTARGETTDKVLGLEMGVDDYMSKPFESRELVARIKSILRRSKVVNTQMKLKAKDLLLDINKRSATLCDHDLNLSTYEFEVLKLFMTHPGQTLSRDKIMDELKGIDWEAYNRSIDVALSRLRQKLKDPAREPIYIKTVWGDGYCFIATVEEIS